MLGWYDNCFIVLASQFEQFEQFEQFLFSHINQYNISMEKAHMHTQSHTRNYYVTNTHRHIDMTPQPYHTENDLSLTITIPFYMKH